MKEEILLPTGYTEDFHYATPHLNMKESLTRPEGVMLGMQMWKTLQLCDWSA